MTFKIKKNEEKKISFQNKIIFLKNINGNLFLLFDNKTFNSNRM